MHNAIEGNEAEGNTSDRWLADKPVWCEGRGLQLARTVTRR